MANTLSIVDYIHELKEVGFTDKQAEVQAKRLEQFAIEVKADLRQEIEAKELATKGNLRETELRLQKEILEVKNQIVEAKNQTLLWTFGMLVLFGGAIISIMAKGFHWW